MNVSGEGFYLQLVARQQTCPHFTVKRVLLPFFHVDMQCASDNAYG